MRSALMWLKLYGRGAVQHKLKKGLKTQKMHFCLFLSLCFWAHGNIGWAPSILPTQGPIHEILTKDIENWQFWKTHFDFFSKKQFFFCFIPMKISDKLYIRIDGTQFLWLWWFTAKNHSPQTFQPGVYIIQTITYQFWMKMISRCNLTVLDSLSLIHCVDTTYHKAHVLL